jgi:VanZ family protein
MTDAPALLWSRKLWGWIFWGLVTAVSVLMLVPQPPPSLDTGWDKLNHVLAFAAPTFAGLAAIGRPTLGRRSALWVGLLLWGAALELLQGQLPPRTADPADWLADAVGVLLGAAIHAAVTARFSAR